MTTAAFDRIRWASFGLALLVPFIAWASYHNWQLGQLSFYQMFGLFGLWAFCIMATHFILAGYRTKWPSVTSNEFYSVVSGTVVLACMLVHPLLLVISLAQNGYGLPPNSYKEFYSSNALLFVYLGTFSLALFLGYELVQHLKNRPVIRNHWYWVLASQVLAMGLIFVHSLRLGNVVSVEWFLPIWLGLGLMVAVSSYWFLASLWSKQQGSEPTKNK